MRRKLKLYDPMHPEGGPVVLCKNDHDCVFCGHCDITWDYTNGPYLLICDLGHDTDAYKTPYYNMIMCPDFDDKEEVPRYEE